MPSSKPRSSLPGVRDGAQKSVAGLVPEGEAAQGTMQARRDYTRRGKRKRRREFLLFSRDDFRCVYCGKSSIEDRVKLEAEHIVPRSKGGKDTTGNFVTSCQTCNRSKFDEDLPDDQVQRLLDLVAERNAKRRISGDLEIKLGRV